MYVCMYVCMYVSLYASVYVCMYVCMYVAKINRNFAHTDMYMYKRHRRPSVDLGAVSIA